MAAAADQIEQGKLPWTAAARERLETVPEFMRHMTRQIAEELAKEGGHLEVNVELFELLALCWESGQASRIHNHRDQQCWMTVPLGTLQVQDFRVMDRDPEKKRCRLEPTKSYALTPARPAEVDVNEPVHQVLNLAEFGGRAVSLHVYSKPFDSCEVYYPEKGNYSDVPLYYTSEYGKLCSGEPANPAS